MKTIRIAAFFVLLAQIAIGQTALIKVLNSENQQQVKQVTLRLIDGSEIFSANGEFKLEIKEGEILTFTSSGFINATYSRDLLIASGYKVLLRESVINLSEVVISASRFEEQKSDVPQQIQIIKASEIRYGSQPTTAEMLQLSGAAFVQKSQLGGGSPILRGFEANKVLLVVDGIRLNNAIYRGGHLQNVLRIDQNSLERAEVVMGPGAVVYGSDALGGVIHFHTKKPKLSESGFAVSGSSNARYSSALNEFTGNIQFNLGSKKWASFTSLTQSSFGDLIQGKKTISGGGEWTKPYQVFRINGRDSIVENSNKFLQSPSGYEQSDLVQKFLIKSGNHIQHDINIQVSTSSNIQRYDRLSEIKNGKPAFAEWFYGPELRVLAAYTLSNTFKTKLYDSYKLSIANQLVKESRNSRDFNATYLTKREEEVGVWNLNFDAEKQGKSIEFRYGIEGFLNHVNSIANKVNASNALDVKSASTRYPNGGSDFNSIAAYVLGSREFTKKWILTTGLRFSQTNLSAKITDTSFYKIAVPTINQNNSALNGSIGLVHAINTKLRIQGNLATGFRVPNVDDLAKVFSTKINQVIVPNFKLNAEKTLNGEVGFNYTVENKLSISSVLWATQLFDAIALSGSTFNGQDSVVYDGVMSKVYTLQNKDNGQVYGFNFNLNYSFTKNISIETQLTNTIGKMSSNGVSSPLDHIPPMFGKTAIQFRKNSFRIDAYAMYNGPKKLKDYSLSGEDNIEYATSNGMPKWITFNIRGQYVWNKNFALKCGIENIFDIQYRTFASGISAPGRNFQLAFQANF